MYRLHNSSKIPKVNMKHDAAYIYGRSSKVEANFYIHGSRRQEEGIGVAPPPQNCEAFFKLNWNINI